MDPYSDLVVILIPDASYIFLFCRVLLEHHVCTAPSVAYVCRSNLFCNGCHLNAICQTEFQGLL